MDHACDALEAAWQTESMGELAELARFLPNKEHRHFPDFLAPLIAVDLEYRWKKGFGTRVEEYVVEFPALVSDGGMPLTLVKDEWRLRAQAGDTPTLEEYLTRFPHLKGQLTAAENSSFPSETEPGFLPAADTATVIAPQPDPSATTVTGRPEVTKLEAATPSGPKKNIPLGTPVRTVEEFFDRLKHLEIVATDQLDSLRDARPALFDGSTPAKKALQKLATALVNRQLLTKFQTLAVLRGTIQRFVLSDYVITDELGQGGMGHVYRAVHRRMKRTVALKVLTADLVGDEDALNRFRREVETVSRLDHPNIVAAHDADVVDGIHYYVMELVNGDDLSVHVKEQGPLPVGKAVDCVLQAARGLEYAHGEGIVHRDIKPHNLLLDADGTVKVLDLGLARLESVDEQAATDGLTASGSMMGTVDYMAPEQAMDSRSADARSDIYSLGCTLFYLATGRPLYGGDTFMKKLLAHRSEPAPSLLEACAGNSPELESLFQAMVAKDPTERPQTMTDVITALQSCLESLDSELSATDGEPPSDPYAPTLVGKPPVDAEFATSVVGFAGQVQAEQLDARFARVLKWVKWLCLLGVIGGIVWGGYAGVSLLLAPQATLVLDSHGTDLKGATITLDGELLATIGENSGVPLLDVPADGADHTLEIARDGAKTFSQTVRFLVAEARVLPVELVDADALPPNYALKFNGKDSYVELSTLTIDKTDPLTIELTVTPDSPGNTLQDLLGAHHVTSESPSSGFALSVSSSGKARVGLGATGAAESRKGSVHWADVHSVEPLLHHAPVHVAFVFNKGVESLYLDGKLQGRQFVGEFRAAPQPLVFGASRDASDDVVLHFGGVLDEVRVSRTARYVDNFVPESVLPGDDQTIALYHFDEGSGNVLHDSSGNGHDGQIVGAEWVKVADAGTDGDITSVIQLRRAEQAAIPDWAQHSHYNHAIQFDGDGDFLEVPTFLLGDGRPFTFEAWINPDDASQAGTVFSTTCTVRKPPQGMKLALDGGNVTGLVHGADTQGNAFVSEIQTGSRVEGIRSRTDAHVAFCFDGSSQHLYLNGQLIDSRRVVGARPSSATLHVGADTNWDDHFPRTLSHFAGRMDEIRVSSGQRYTEAFTPQRTLEADETTLALYHCDEGVGDVAHDHSGNGHHARLVDARWIRRRDADARIAGPLMLRAPFDADEARQRQQEWADFLGVPLEFENSVGMRLRLIPPGEFYMGSTEEEQRAAVRSAPPFRRLFGYESRLHRVGLREPLYVATYEVTQGQIKEVIGSNPSAFAPSGSEKARVAGQDTSIHPADSVRLDVCEQFLGKLNRVEGIPAVEHMTVASARYRLPTEAEWEYACRAGTLTSRFFPADDDIGEYAWYGDNSKGRTHPVGTLSANAFGLYDMLGNVKERCLDLWPESSTSQSLDELWVDPFGGVDAADMSSRLRVLKGGGWEVSSARIRSGFRTGIGTGALKWDGMRVVLPIQSETLPVIRAVTTTRTAVSSARRGVVRDALENLKNLADGPDVSPFQREQLSRVYALIVNSAEDTELPQDSNAEGLTMQAITHLEWLADRGHIKADDLTHSDFESLDGLPRFLLLRERLSLTKNYRLKRVEIAERHWPQYASKYVNPESAVHPSELTADGTYHQTFIRASLALLTDDAAGFETICQEYFANSNRNLLIAVLSPNSYSDLRAELQRLIAGNSKDPKPWNLYRIAYLHYHLGEWEAAIAAAQESQNLDPNWAHIMNHVVTSMAMHQLGRTGEAREFLASKRLEFDSLPQQFHDPLGYVDILTLAVWWREAEDLIFGRSDNRELDQVMSLARGGETAEALERLAALESRIDEMTPRFKYYMARSYAQCWHHMRHSADAADDELNRIHDRAIELLEELRRAELLDTNRAHLAIDFRPLADDAEFLSFCRKLNPEFDRAMTKLEALDDISQRLKANDEAPDPATVSDVIRKLESSSDRGLLTSKDLDDPELGVLEAEPQFLLLRERLRLYQLPARRHELRERHWQQLDNQYTDSDPRERWSDFFDKRAVGRFPIAALALLNNDRQRFEKHCEEYMQQFGNALNHTVLASNPYYDAEAAISRLEAGIANRGAKCFDYWRISYLKYGQGKWNEAIDAARKSRDVEPRWSGHILNDIVTSMAMQQLGRTDEARTLLQEKLSEYDSDPIGAQEGHHHTELLTLVVWRWQAEELILGRSDSHEMDEIMSLARGGKPGEALERLEPFEERVDSLSPRFRYYMARSYAQCWHHLRNDDATPNDEKARLRDRAIELLTQLHDAGSLDPKNAFLAIDLRPLASEPEFLDLCRRMSSDFDRALIQAAERAAARYLFQQAASLASTDKTDEAISLAKQIAEDNQPLPAAHRLELARVLNLYVQNNVDDPTGAEISTILQEAIQHLEWCADRGRLHLVDLDSGDFRTLAATPRFALLRERLRVTDQWIVGRHAFREQHFEECAREEITQSNAWQKHNSSLTNQDHLDLMNAGIHLLSNNEQAFDALAEKTNAEDTWIRLLLAIISTSDVFDRASMLQSTHLSKTDDRPWGRQQKAALHYRMGEYDEAIQAAETSLTMDWYPTLHALNRLIIAMSVFQKGDPLDAETRLRSALEELDKTLHVGFTQIHINELPMLSVLRREAEELILGRSDRRRFDDIMSRARNGQITDIDERLSPFVNLGDDLSPRYRYDLARVYAQCARYAPNSADSGDQSSADQYAGKSIEMLEQLAREGWLTSDSHAHLAIDLRPLITYAEFYNLCRRLSPEIPAYDFDRTAVAAQK